MDTKKTKSTKLDKGGKLAWFIGRVLVQMSLLKRAYQHYIFIGIGLLLPYSTILGQMTLSFQPPPNSGVGRSYYRNIKIDSTLTQIEIAFLKTYLNSFAFSPLQYDSTTQRVCTKLGVKTDQATTMPVPMINYIPTPEYLLKAAATTAWQLVAERKPSNSTFDIIWSLPEVNVQWQTITRQYPASLPKGYQAGETLLANEYWIVEPEFDLFPLYHAQAQQPLLIKLHDVNPQISYERATCLIEHYLYDWEEIPAYCAPRPSKIVQLQQTLQKRGYYKGVLDNIFDAEVREALIRFQKENNLPIGNLNLVTLRYLGIE